MILSVTVTASASHWALVTVQVHSLLMGETFPGFAL